MYWFFKKNNNKNRRRKIQLYLDPDLIDFLRFRESRETGIYCDTGVNKQHNNPVPENSYFCPGPSGDIFSSISKCRILRNMPDTTSASAHHFLLTSTVLKKKRGIDVASHLTLSLQKVRDTGGLDIDCKVKKKYTRFLAGIIFLSTKR